MNLKLIAKREAWCLTWRGWAMVLVVPSLMVLIGIRSCSHFLSLNRPIEAEVLIVEGWLPDYALQDAVQEYRRGNYKYIITAGSPLLGGYYLSDLKTSADLAAAALVKFGISSNEVVSVPGPAVMRGRSLAHARAVRDWMQVHDPHLRRVNIYSLGVHSRRTRMLFAQVFGEGFKVGAISHADAAYDSDCWWRSSQGFRTVTEEALGYAWACASGRQ